MSARTAAPISGRRLHAETHREYATLPLRDIQGSAACSAITDMAAPRRDELSEPDRPTNLRVQIHFTVGANVTGCFDGARMQPTCASDSAKAQYSSHVNDLIVLGPAL